MVYFNALANNNVLNTFYTKFDRNVLHAMLSPLKTILCLLFIEFSLWDDIIEDSIFFEIWEPSLSRDLTMKDYLGYFKIDSRTIHIYTDGFRVESKKIIPFGFSLLFDMDNTKVRSIGKLIQ